MLDVQQLLCQLVVKKKSLQKSKLSDVLSTVLLHNALHCQSSVPRGQHVRLAAVPCGIFHREIVFLSLVLGGKRCPQQLRAFSNSKLSAACRTGLLEVFPLQVCHLIFLEFDLDFCISP